MAGKPPGSFTLQLEGKGSPGWVKGTARIQGSKGLAEAALRHPTPLLALVKSEYEDEARRLGVFRPLPDVLSCNMQP
jgi:hypothetical protein